MKSVVYCFILLLYMVGCRGNDATAGRTSEERKRISVLDDSIAAMSPHAPDMIAHGIKSAPDSLTWYDYYLRYGKYWGLSQTPDSMLPYISRTIGFADRQEPSPRVNGLKALAYESMAFYWQRHRQRLDTVIALRTTAYLAMMESDDKDFLPEMCANMADTYVQMNDMAHAASWYRRALFLVDSLRLPDMKNVTLYLGLAQIYMNLEDYEASLKYYKECGAFYDRMQPNMKVYYLNNFGNYYYFRSDYRNALKMFLRMKELLEHYDDESIDMATCRINLADVYLNLGNYSEAKACLDAAERFFAATGIDIGVYYAHSIRIGMAVRQGRTADVRRILDSERFDPPLEYSIVGIRNRYLREYYKATGNWHAAFDNLEADIRARDSIEAARQHMRASEIMQRLKEDTLSLHHAMEIQQKDAMLRTTHITTATVVVMAVLLALLWAAYSRKRKLQTDMDMMLLRLDNTRNRISPHFIFNVLNNHISTSGTKERDELMMLVKLIRTNLDISRNTFVSLAEEMEFVRYYIDIEKKMLGDDFTVTVTAPEERVLKEISIPTMFVQILVENAIKHGLKGKEGPKLLTIGITTGQQGTDIVVTDNGDGFDIRSMTGNGTKTGLDIIRHTIRIINERMKHDELTFGIHNRKDGSGSVTGCETRLHIPLLPPPEIYLQTV